MSLPYTLWLLSFSWSMLYSQTTVTGAKVESAPITLYWAQRFPLCPQHVHSMDIRAVTNSARCRAWPCPVSALKERAQVPRRLARTWQLPSLNVLPTEPVYVAPRGKLRTRPAINLCSEQATVAPCGVNFSSRSKQSQGIVNIELTLVAEMVRLSERPRRGPKEVAPPKDRRLPTTVTCLSPTNKTRSITAMHGRNPPPPPRLSSVAAGRVLRSTVTELGFVHPRNGPRLLHDRYLHNLLLLLTNSRVRQHGNGMELRVQGQEARERYGRQLHARLVSHRSYAQGVQCFRRDAVLYKLDLDVDMEWRRNARGRLGETGDPRENPPTSGIVRARFPRAKTREWPRRELNPRCSLGLASDARGTWDGAATTSQPLCLGDTLPAEEEGDETRRGWYTRCGAQPSCSGGASETPELRNTGPWSRLRRPAQPLPRASPQTTPPRQSRVNITPVGAPEGYQKCSRYCKQPSNAEIRSKRTGNRGRIAEVENRRTGLVNIGSPDLLQWEYLIKVDAHLQAMEQASPLCPLKSHFGIPDFSLFSTQNVAVSPDLLKRCTFSPVLYCYVLQLAPAQLSGAVGGDPPRPPLYLE
ncbi:hypothetical protein PR048_031314 [Dryococelus australis]|uniref:Uncharacterized protein n=1 Tax=Dryococelus australis TaxID=614101 RepID=A0ABQ9G613_9NEOP|nr:hypothetical protein PR048_031314 [Dryococelus australis]